MYFDETSDNNYQLVLTNKSLVILLFSILILPLIFDGEQIIIKKFLIGII